MSNHQPKQIHSIAAFHRYRELPEPENPLISVVNVEDISYTGKAESLLLDFYSIALKRHQDIRFKYGQQQYDFDAGVMFFVAPGQIFSIEHTAGKPADCSGWVLLIHPDFLWNTPLAKTIRKYEYFDYAVNEALFLSPKEEAVLNNIVDIIRKEYHSSIDKFTQSIIIPQIESLLNYAERFYQRQFVTRKITNHHILARFEEILSQYLDSNQLLQNGLPTVQYMASALNISPNYLGTLLRTLTGKNTQQHIHDSLIEKAKEKISTTALSVSEIAYELGFEHPQSFSRFFKSKTGLSPLAFKAAFN